MKALEVEKREKNDNLNGGKSTKSYTVRETIIIIDDDRRKNEYFTTSSNTIQDKSQQIMLTRSRAHE